MSGAFPTAVVRYTELPGRLDTYAVHAGLEPTPPLLGYIRHDADSAAWVARTLGSDVDAANIRRGFKDRFAAVSWLQHHVETLP